MISINIHLSTPMKIKVVQLPSCTTLVLFSEENEVVYYLKSVEDAREVRNALDQAILESEATYD